jgi:hypothetical protein
MADDVAKFVETQHGFMKGRRANWESHWQEIAERILPSHAVFNRKYMYGGEKRTHKIFDATSAFALTRFAAIMESLLTPHSQIWHKLKTPFPELNMRDDVAAYFDAVNRLLFGMRYSPQAGYIAATQEYYLSAGAFGTGAVFLSQEFINGKPQFRYISIPLSELFVRTDFAGKPVMCIREFERTASQIIREFGGRAGADIPKDVSDAAEKDPDRKYTIMHYVGPSDDAPKAGRRKDDFVFASFYVIQDLCHTLSAGGYYSFPYIIGRYMTAPAEEYGRSPAMIVLPDIKMLNEMSRTNIRAAHRRAEPPLLTVEDGALSRISMKPNSINMGGLNEQGQQLIQPMRTDGDVGLSLEMMDQRRNMINEAFFITLFQILVETPRMTATEVIQRAQEKSSLLSPIMGRQQTELLGPMIDRELDLLDRMGLLPPMPEALIEVGGSFVIEYDSPLTRMQQSEEVGGIMRTLESVLPLMQLDPQIADNFDFDSMTRILARSNGAPVAIMKSLEMVEGIRAQRAEQQDAQNQAAMLEPASNAAKNVAQAQKFRSEAGA